MAVFLIVLLHSTDMGELLHRAGPHRQTVGGAHRLALTFTDGFAAEIDLAPLLDWGPLYEPLRDEANFRKVTVSPHGVPEWVDDDFRPIPRHPPRMVRDRQDSQPGRNGQMAGRAPCLPEEGCVALAMRSGCPLLIEFLYRYVLL